MEIRGFAYSKQGVGRDHNEDRFILDKEINLFAVCDGMGGALSGEVASSMAVEKITDFVKQNIKKLPSPEKIQPGDQRARKLVEESILEACSEIHTNAMENPGRSGMGTTASVVLIYGQFAVIGHVGDSRIYLLRNGNLVQISRDHTFVQEMVDSGNITLENAKKSPYAHVITRAVGVQQFVQVEMLQIELLPKDRLLICSDGLSDRIIERETIISLLHEKLESCPEILVNQAVISGSYDDTTAVVVEIGETAQTSVEKERIERVNLTMDVLRKVYIFEDLDAEDLMRVVERCRIVNIGPAEKLMMEGDAGNSMYIILRGFLEVSRAGKVITGLGQGNHVGEMSLLSGSPRAADVHTLTPTMLLELTEADFQKLISEHPKLGVRLLLALSRELSGRLNATNQLVQ